MENIIIKVKKYGVNIKALYFTYKRLVIEYINGTRHIILFNKEFTLSKIQKISTLFIKEFDYEFDIKF